MKSPLRPQIPHAPDVIFFKKTSVLQCGTSVHLLLVLFMAYFGELMSPKYYLTDIPWAPHQLWFYSIYLCFDVNFEFIGGILFIRQEHIVICAFQLKCWSYSNCHRQIFSCVKKICENRKYLLQHLYRESFLLVRYHAIGDWLILSIAHQHSAKHRL